MLHYKVDPIPEKEGVYPARKPANKCGPEYDSLRESISWAKVFIRDGERELMDCRNHHKRTAEQLRAKLTQLLEGNSLCAYTEDLDG